MRIHHRRVRGIRRWAAALLCACATAASGQTPTLDAALTALRQAGADVGQQAAAVRTLGTLGTAAEEALLGQLADDDRQVRINAALALGRLRVVAAVEPLLARCREDVDPEVRCATAEALGRIRDQRAVAPLLGTLTAAEGDELDRRGAAVALGSLRAAEAVDALLKLLESANWEERWRAAVALGQIGEARARTALGRLAGDENAVVAGCAAWAGSVLVNAPDAKALERNLQSPDAAVVWGSAWALGVIGTTAATEALLVTFRNGPPAGQEASAMVLAWLGMPMAEAPSRAVPAVPVAAAAAEGTLALDERWSDRYGQLEIQITRPAILSTRAARPDLGAHARPCLYRLPNGDLLLLVDPNPGSVSAAWAALRSPDQGQTWQSEPALVHRPAAVAMLRNRSVLVYDQYLFQKEGHLHVSDLCVSRDGGRSFGPLQLAEFALPAEQVTRSQPKEVVAAYQASSAHGSGRGHPTFNARVVETADGTLVACGLARDGAATPHGGLCFRSADRGLAWTAAPLRPRDEIVALALAGSAGNRLVALLAVGTEAALHASFSADAGASWSEPRSLRAQGAALDVCRLSSGVLACCYGGPGISLMFSVDGTGKAWTDKIRLIDADAGVSGWASLCETGPDQMLLVYDQQGVVPEVGTDPTHTLRAVTITARRAGAATPERP